MDNSNHGKLLFLLTLLLTRIGRSLQRYEGARSLPSTSFRIAIARENNEINDMKKRNTNLKKEKPN
ncbi:hypothetical protein [Bartonella schoenbuchensis]|uniref:hypothetical protein n=1 Tax=Bartonella schoenbuchensis TaxID=165694 RepID=UPI0011461D82|nr:hypothetical protein [Bartonella schoenbuchensis]